MHQLVDDPPQRSRAEAGVVFAVLIHLGHHRKHHVQLAADQVPRVPDPVLRPAADDVEQVPDLSRKGVCGWFACCVRVFVLPKFTRRAKATDTDDHDRGGIVFLLASDRANQLTDAVVADQTKSSSDVQQSGLPAGGPRSAGVAIDRTS